MLMAYRTFTTDLRLGAAAVLTVGLALSNYAQVSAQGPPDTRRPASQRVGGPRNAPFPGLQARRQQAQRAREVMGLFLRQGHKQPYIGEQVTQVIAGGLESRQLVKHRGPWQDRIEFLSPARMEGEVILQNGGRFLHYKPSQRVILEGVASPEFFLGQARELLTGIREGRIKVLVVGSQVVAEQPATIIETRTPEGGWRLWIDDKTGVRLKSEQLNAHGAVSVTSYFTKIDYSPTFAPADFQPAALPRVRREASLPSGPPLANIQAAQRLVDYAIREPSVPAGVHLVGVWVVELPGGKVTVLRYSDGPNNFNLFEQRARSNAANAPSPTVGSPRRNLRHWTSGGVAFSLIGNLRPATMQQISDSLQ
jgi:hypothetical protein